MQKNNLLSSVKQYLKISLLETIIILAVVLGDLISKSVVSKALCDGESFTLIPKFLHFTYTKNYAAAFSFDFGLSKLVGSGGVRIFFIVLTFLALGLFFYMLFSAKQGNKFYRISLALIIGGAIGNLYDRIFYGFVRDFIDVEYFGKKLFGSYHFAIFNIADCALVIGVIMLAVYFIFIYKEPATTPTSNFSVSETTTVVPKLAPVVADQNSENNSLEMEKEEANKLEVNSVEEQSIVQNSQKTGEEN